MSNTLRALTSLIVAAFVVSVFATSPASAQEKKKVLFLTKSTGFQHSVITRDWKDPKKPAHAERLLTEFAGKNGYEVTFTKDADVFNDPKTYGTYAVIAFYTTEDLTKPSDKYDVKRDEKGQPVKGPDGKTERGELLHTEKPMSAEGKAMFLKAIDDGKVGFIGFHCASDTFHSKNRNNPELLRDAQVKDPVDPYIAMCGGEFAGHGAQQKALMKVVSRDLPGLTDLQEFTLHEEWYNLKNLAPDMHAILVQDKNTMEKPEPMYDRPAFPATWARKQGKGRVFYTSMGHREQVWENPIFQKITIAGLDWVSGKTAFEAKPNIDKVAPQKPGQSQSADAR
jgi:uncharacterized protein